MKSQSLPLVRHFLWQGCTFHTAPPSGDQVFNAWACNRSISFKPPEGLTMLAHGLELKEFCLPLPPRSWHQKMRHHAQPGCGLHSGDNFDVLMISWTWSHGFTCSYHVCTTLQFATCFHIGSSLYVEKKKVLFQLHRRGGSKMWACFHLVWRPDK